MFIYLVKIKPSANASPKLLMRFSARFPLKGRLQFSICSLDVETQIFHKIMYKLRLIRPLLGYGEVAKFLKEMFQSFDQITTLTYVLMDNFCPSFCCKID